MIATLNLFGAIGIFLAFPFVMMLGAEFFLPLAGAIIVAIALVPSLEWLERRGLPSALAAAICVLGFLLAVNAALAVIVLPASDWFIELPERLPRIRNNIAPLIDLYANLQEFVDRSFAMVTSGPIARAEAAGATVPSSVVDLVATSAPSAAIQIFFAILVIFFLLAGWRRTRTRTIEAQDNFDNALKTARVIQNVVSATSAYLGTITLINVTLGVTVALALWAIGLPSPLMWGGIVALFNFIPYVGPIAAALLLLAGGLMTYDTIGMALLPAAIMAGFHLIEANLVTPVVLGRRLTMNPLLILISLSYWGWIWGAPGALLAVPILVIVTTVFNSTGLPQFLDFLLHGNDIDDSKDTATP
ncbi:MAG: AI-2E family transporter [Sphingomonadales bacterium]|nr:AI-2E family transporter [Sphingomonadales bacterium]